MRKLTLIAGWGLWTALAAASSAAAQQLDSIQGFRGAADYGTVLGMTATEVTFDVRGTTKKFAANDIRKVTFSGEPNELRSGRESALENQFERARAELDKIATDSITRKEMLQDIEFWKAYCDARLALSGGGDKNASVMALRNFVEKSDNQGNYHYYTAVELLGQLAQALARYDYAVQYYETLGKAPWPDYKMRADLLTARALAASEKYAAAVQKYDAVLGATLESAKAAELKLDASIGKAVCVAETGDPQQGIQTLVKIIQDNDPDARQALFGRAYNALGDCYRKANRTEDALLAYLHVHLLFFQEPETHAEALFRLCELWKAVNKPEQAADARSKLTSIYAGTVWAQRINQ